MNRHTAELRSRTSAIEVQSAAELNRRRSRIAIVLQALKEFQSWIDLADVATFGRYVAEQFGGSQLIVDMTAPFPNVEQLLLEADQQAQSQWMPVSRPAKAVPVLPVVESTKIGSPVALSAAPKTTSAQPKPACLSLPRSASPDRNRLIELEFQFIFAVARTDGSISNKERVVIREYIRERYGSDPAELNLANGFAAHAESAALNVDSVLESVVRNFPRAEQQRLVDLACRIAEASGPMNQKEVRLMNRIATAFGITWSPTEIAKTAPAPAVPPLIQPPNPTVADVVESTPTVSEDRMTLEIDSKIALEPGLIRRQYHRQKEKFDAERLAHLGDEFVAIAGEKLEKARAAAERLIATFGEPLERPEPPPPESTRENPDLDAVFGV